MQVKIRLLSRAEGRRRCWCVFLGRVDDRKLDDFPGDILVGLPAA